MANRDFIRESTEYPTIRLENASLIAHRELASPVRRSVTSLSHNGFSASAVQSRFTASSCTGGPTLPRFLPNTLHHLLSVQIRQAVRCQLVAARGPGSRACVTVSLHARSSRHRPGGRGTVDFMAGRRSYLVKVMVC